MPSQPVGQRVAIVGAGPAGLMAAWELGLRGYGVTVFEEQPRVGGLMQTIPAYRISDADIQVDRARLRGLDVTFVTDRKIGADGPVERLLEEGYRAVLLAVGTSDHRTLGIPGEDLPGVVPALEFLRAENAGTPIPIGREVVVVGGGDVAMDAVRTALRRAPGTRVTLLYRRTREEMPADAQEIHEAEAEGIRFVFLRAPDRILGDAHVQGLIVQRMELGPPNPSGRRAPVAVPGPMETVPCDTVVVAVGQKADLEGMGPELGLRLASGGWPEGTAPGFATERAGVFAVGGRSVVYAMGAASEAAAAIDAYLCAARGVAPSPRPDPFGGPEPAKLPAGYTKPIRS